MSGATAASSPPEPLPPERMRAPGFASNLARRAGTGLVALPVVVALLLEGPPWLAVTIIVLALALGLAEFFRLLAARGMRPLRAAGALLAAAFFLEVVAPGWLSVPFVPLGALLLLTLTLGRGGDRESVSAAAATLLGAIYLGALGGTIAALRLQPPVEAGGLRLVLLLAIQVFSDSIAYFVGHGVGRRRLLPSVSPGKSVEGALGGLLGGVLGAFAARELWLPDLPAWHTAALGLAVAAMGIVGDLDESLLKRWAGVKDSGRLFPGHGGMLDRLDSLLFGAPVLYYYFEFVR